MSQANINPLLSTTKASDAPRTVKLHPLVLLTITDFITRHTLTGRQGPIAGAVIGQQDGRETTLEHAFECPLQSKPSDDNKERIVLTEPWFRGRLAQYKEVHASPPLDLVAAFTLGSTKGPSLEHVPLVQQLKAEYNDDIILILFHPETVLDGSLTGGKLPITIYESFYEPGTESADKGLQVDGWGIGRQLQLKFRQLPFEVETGEAEMIAVDYVAKGAANANIAVDTTRKASIATSGKAKEKEIARTGEEASSAQEQTLSAEDDELIASLTSKSNAIKMLRTRVNLIRAYLASLPPSYLTDASLTPNSDTDINHVLLRQISSLLGRLHLLAPPASSSTSEPSFGATVTSAQPTQGIKEADSVALINLLSTLTRTIASTSDLTQKANVVNRARHDKRMAGLARENVDTPPFGGAIRSGRYGKGGGAGGGMPLGASSNENYEGGFDSGADGFENDY